MLRYFGNRLEDQERKKEKEREKERERTEAIKIYEIIGSECNFREIIELL